METGTRGNPESLQLEKVLGAWQPKKCQRWGTFSVKAVGRGQSSVESYSVQEKQTFLWP